MRNIDALSSKVTRLIETIKPQDASNQEYRQMLSTLNDAELRELQYQLEPGSRPPCTQEEMIVSFLSIDSDAVPESLVSYPISRIGYRVVLQHVQDENIDALTYEYLLQWYQWKEQKSTIVPV